MRNKLVITFSVLACMVIHRSYGQFPTYPASYPTSYPPQGNYPSFQHQVGEEDISPPTFGFPRPSRGRGNFNPMQFSPTASPYGGGQNPFDNVFNEEGDKLNCRMVCLSDSKKLMSKSGGRKSSGDRNNKNKKDKEKTSSQEEEDDDSNDDEKEKKDGPKDDKKNDDDKKDQDKKDDDKKKNNKEDK